MMNPEKPAKKTRARWPAFLLAIGGGLFLIIFVSFWTGLLVVNADEAAGEVFSLTDVVPMVVTVAAVVGWLVLLTLAVLIAAGRLVPKKRYPILLTAAFCIIWCLLTMFVLPHVFPVPEVLVEADHKAIGANIGTAGMVSLVVAVLAYLPLKRK